MNNPDYLISTPENVDLHIELAGLGSRIGAAFIDTLLSYSIMMMVILFAVLAGFVVERLDFPRDTKTVIDYYIIGITLLLVFCVNFGYFICFEGLWQGQTPGKKLAQIRVIEANGQPVNWPSVWIRNLMRLIDSGIAMIGLVSMLLDKNERRLGDFAAGTLVIRERPAELSARNLRVQVGDVPLSFVDAGQISPDEYHLLVSFLKRRHTMVKDSRGAVARQMEEYFRLKLNPETNADAPEDFLEKLYVAYGSRAESERL
ncbi:MAG: RDD family protein [Candidatus Obscuribacterales bacterium]|nr:RDD family protein [Candidatus Obscuribacterales bacterium]